MHNRIAHRTRWEHSWVTYGILKLIHKKRDAVPTFNIETSTVSMPRLDEALVASWKLFTYIQRHKNKSCSIWDGLLTKKRKGSDQNRQFLGWVNLGFAIHVFYDVTTTLQFIFSSTSNPFWCLHCEAKYYSKVTIFAVREA